MSHDQDVHYDDLEPGTWVGFVPVPDDAEASRPPAAPPLRTPVPRSLVPRSNPVAPPALDALLARASRAGAPLQPPVEPVAPGVVGAVAGEVVGEPARPSAPDTHTVDDAEPITDDVPAADAPEAGPGALELETMHLLARDDDAGMDLAPDDLDALLADVPTDLDDDDLALAIDVLPGGFAVPATARDDAPDGPSAPNGPDAPSAGPEASLVDESDGPHGRTTSDDAVDELEFDLADLAAAVDALDLGDTPPPAGDDSGAAPDPAPHARACEDTAEVPADDHADPDAPVADAAVPHPTAPEARDVPDGATAVDVRPGRSDDAFMTELLAGDEESSPVGARSGGAPHAGAPHAGDARDGGTGTEDRGDAVRDAEGSGGASDDWHHLDADDLDAFDLDDDDMLDFVIDGDDVLGEPAVFAFDGRDEPGEPGPTVRETTAPATTAPATTALETAALETAALETAALGTAQDPTTHGRATAEDAAAHGAMTDADLALLDALGAVDPVPPDDGINGIDGADAADRIDGIDGIDEDGLLATVLDADVAIPAPEQPSPPPPAVSGHGDLDGMPDDDLAPVADHFAQVSTTAAAAPPAPPPDAATASPAPPVVDGPRRVDLRHFTAHGARRGGLLARLRR